MNGLIPLETMQDIIVKVEETKQVVEKVKNSFENVILRVQSEFPSLEVIAKYQVGGLGTSHQ